MPKAQRALAHEYAEEGFGLVSHSTGSEPNRAVQVFKTPSSGGLQEGFVRGVSCGLVGVGQGLGLRATTLGLSQTARCRFSRHPRQLGLIVCAGV